MRRTLKVLGIVVAVPVVLLGLVIAGAMISSSLAGRSGVPAGVSPHVQSRVHFNTNVSDFARARAFYGTLGFQTVSGFPDANTQAMARAIGIETPTDYDGAHGGEPGGYLLHGKLIGLGDFLGGLIDLIEFSIPRNDDPPYPRLNRLGMVYATMTSEDVDGDYDRMRQQGVEFLTPPVNDGNGNRFAMFRDPDGVFYRLLGTPDTPRQTPDAGGSATAASAMRIVALNSVTINVSNLERSVDWYRMLGYESVDRSQGVVSREIAAALGFDTPVTLNRARLVHRVDGSEFELVQWLDPYDPTPPYPVPVNHIGIHRVALTTTNMDADVAMLRSRGVTFLSEPTPCCSGPDSWGEIVAFYDPDGVVMELVETPVFGDLIPLLIWLRDLGRD